MKQTILIIIFIIGLITPALADNTACKLQFFGIQGQLLNDIQARLDHDQSLIDLNTYPKVQAYKDEIMIEVKDILAAYGYFAPSIRVTSSHQNQQWLIQLVIHPGRPTHISQLDVQIKGEANCDPAFQAYLHNFPLHQGDIVNSKIYQDAKSALMDLAVQRGYFDAQITQSKLMINVKQEQASVILQFDSGPRYYFGRINFLPSPYSQRLLKRFVPFKAGMVYQNDQVINLQENLAKSSFFQQVTVTPRPEMAENLTVPIDITLVPRKAMQYNLGGGFGSDTGLRGIADIEFRRLNRFGHSVKMLAQGSQRVNHGEASYVIPGPNPVTDYYKFSVIAENQNLPTSGKSRNEKGEVSYINSWHHWQQTLSLSLRDEHSHPTDDRPIINSTMLLPNINWSKVESDNPLSPNCGYLLNINLRGASKSIVSNVDFLQALIQAKYLTTFHENTRLIAKGQLGYTVINDVDFLPISLQFYTGGAQTVRGYRYQEIGPGRTLLLASLELQQRIKGNFYGAIFFDAGNVSNDLSIDLKKSIGLGIVWRSPIGAIEVTLAQALDQPGHPKLLQFSMGPEL